MLLTALLAAAAMLIQDICGVLLVQAEARNRAGLAALFDSIMWLAQISTVTISVTALQGHQFDAKAIIILFVEAANIAGCFAGVAIGRRWIRETKAACGCGCPVPAKEAG